jgi:NAD(P)-dependent dehydrogenase (short-subunit alcohol dehydrogenase family)
MSTSKGAAIVTGASQGIGRAIAIQLASDGYAVAVNDLPARQAEVEALVAELGRAIVVLGDVSREEDIKEMITRTVNELGNLEVVSEHRASREYMGTKWPKFVANAALPQCGTLESSELIISPLRGSILNHVLS